MNMFSSKKSVGRPATQQGEEGAKKVRRVTRVSTDSRAKRAHVAAKEVVVAAVSVEDWLKSDDTVVVEETRPTQKKKEEKARRGHGGPSHTTREKNKLTDTAVEEAAISPRPVDGGQGKDTAEVLRRVKSLEDGQRRVEEALQRMQMCIGEQLREQTKRLERGAEEKGGVVAAHKGVMEEWKREAGAFLVMLRQAVPAEKTGGAPKKEKHAPGGQESEKKEAKVAPMVLKAPKPVKATVEKTAAEEESMEELSFLE
jgi:uncharacterized protein (UPF0335 family)